jgi:predicted MFS family arabinose efflux permease
MTQVSAVLGGIIVGPILLVPLVRVFGVMSCCFCSMIFVAVTSVWSAVSTGESDYGSFVASRFVAGIFCPVPQIFSSGVIAHIFFLHQRGKAFAVYSTIYMIAQVAGPTFSGYIVQFVDWPVVFWWTVGANGLAALLFFLFGEETAWDRESNQPVAKHEIPKTWIGRRVALFFFGTTVAPTGPLRSSAKSLQAVFAIGFSPVTVLCGIFSLFAFGW